MKGMFYKCTLLALLAFMLGCSNQQTKSSSSVVDYLYPKGTNEIVQPSIPTLKLPLKVGIAFVPESTTEQRGINQWSSNVGGGPDLSAKTKNELLQEVANNFNKLNFINKVEIIPTEYLTKGGSFGNLEQIRTMYDIDVIALVSYDQVQFTDGSFLSLTYWTIVGAYVVAGEKNDTSTMLDTVVYDIASKKMLFRAPGTSVVKGRATPINLTEELRIDSNKGFHLAAKEMTSNLQTQLSIFKEKIKNNPSEVKIEHRDGYSAGGSFDFYAILFLIFAGMFLRKKI